MLISLMTCGVGVGLIGFGLYLRHMKNDSKRVDKVTILKLLPKPFVNDMNSLNYLTYVDNLTLFNKYIDKGDNMSATRVLRACIDELTSMKRNNSDKPIDDVIDHVIPVAEDMILNCKFKHLKQ